MQSKFELTIGPRLGPGGDDAKEASILNRIVRYTAEGVMYEADPRQAERLIQECGLEGAKSVATPGLKETSAQLAEEKDLEPGLHTAYRSSAARANYLAADRIDCQYASKEICRWMSAPKTTSWAAMKRIVRYLNGAPRLVYAYGAQQVEAIDVYVDTDWAGCPRTRRSTSGGSVMMGSHTIKTWSSIQTGVALSSGEAELNGVLKGSAMGLGFQSLLQDLGIQVPLRVWTDSSAAIGICNRQGLGKLRHLDTHLLWIQQAVRNRRVDLRKIAGEVNPADLFTKHLASSERVNMLVGLHGCSFVSGRAATAPQTRTGQTGKKTIAEADLNAAEHEPVPIMPHLEYTREALDLVYPSLVAAQDVVESDETDWDSWDKIMVRGEEIIKEIRERTISDGRRRWQTPVEQEGRDESRS
jgi:hypothetical protein